VVSEKSLSCAVKILGVISFGICFSESVDREGPKSPEIAEISNFQCTHITWNIAKLLSTSSAISETVGLNADTSDTKTWMWCHLWN
jgi:hypothetical protein